MADLYWVGGTDDWNGTAGLKWSLLSGGVGGAPEPTAADDVHFDGPSGAVTVTVATSTRPCRSINFTGFTGTFAGSVGLDIGDATVGHFTLGSGMTWTNTGLLTFVSTTGTNNLTFNGVTITATLRFNGAAGIWSFQDALTQVTGNPGGENIRVGQGTLNTNGYTITTDAMFRHTALDAGYTAVTNLGASIINITSYNTVFQVNIVFGTSTFNAETSTINITDASANVKTFTGGGATYYNVAYTGGGSGRCDISGSNTFNILTLGAPKSYRIAAGTTQTILTSFVLQSSSGNVITIDTNSGGSAATISKAAGTVIADYLSLKDSAATGGATFYAGVNSTNVSGNSGWIFAGPPKTDLMSFFD